MELSSPPAPSTLAHAEIVLTMEKAAFEETPELIWKRIMEEEPLEGEHWQEIGDLNRSRSTPPPDLSLIPMISEAVPKTLPSRRSRTRHHLITKILQHLSLHQSMRSFGTEWLWKVSTKSVLKS